MDTADIDALSRQVQFLRSPRIKKIRYQWLYGKKGNSPSAISIELENTAGETAAFVMTMPNNEEGAIMHGSFDFERGWEEPCIGHASVMEGEFS